MNIQPEKLKGRDVYDAPSVNAYLETLEKTYNEKQNDLRSRFRSLQREAEDLQRRLDAAESALDETRRELDGQRHMAKQMKDELLSLRDANEEKEATIAALNEEISRLCEEMDARPSLYEGLRDMVDGLNKRLDEMQTDLKDTIGDFCCDYLP